MNEFYLANFHFQCNTCQKPIILQQQQRAAASIVSTSNSKTAENHILNESPSVSHKQTATKDKGTQNDSASSDSPVKSAYEHNQDIFIDERNGDIICLKCGEVLYGRIVNPGAEEILYQEDYESGQISTRTSGKGEYFGSQDTIYVAGPEEYRKILDRAQRAIANKKDKKIMANLLLINDLAGKLNVTPAVKVSL